MRSWPDIRQVIGLFCRLSLAKANYPNLTVDSSMTRLGEVLFGYATSSTPDSGSAPKSGARS